MKEPKTTKQKLLLFAAALLFLGINCIMQSKFVLPSLTGSISSLTYCTAPPHVCALASPSHLLINFTNSSYHSSFQYTITRSNSPAIKSLIPFLIHHFCSSLFQLQVLKFNFIQICPEIHQPIFLLKPLSIFSFLHPLYYNVCKISNSTTI